MAAADQQTAADRLLHPVNSNSGSTQQQSSKAAYQTTTFHQLPGRPGMSGDNIATGAAVAQTGADVMRGNFQQSVQALSKPRDQDELS